MVTSSGISMIRSGLGIRLPHHRVHHRVHHGTGISSAVAGALINHLIGGSYKITGAGKKRAPGRPRTKLGRPIIR